MSTVRTLVLLEPKTRSKIKGIAKQDGVSLSSKCRELIHEALEIHEDAYWSSKASEREKHFDWKKGISHDDAWGA